MNIQKQLKAKGQITGDFSILENTKPAPKIFFNTCFDKNHLKSLIAWFLDYYGEKKTVDLVETLKQVGFHQATLAGVSLGVDDLQIPPQKSTLLSQASVNITEATHASQIGNVTSVEKSQALIDTWNQTSETLRQLAVQNFRTTNPVNPVYMMAFSGARGNISQVRQLVAMRGLMADPQGAILEFPIQSNFREGLTVTEYLISCFGARKGLVDTALRTATSGYLTRRLVDAVQHVVIHMPTCKTKRGIVLKEKNLEQRLIGRVLLQDIQLDDDIIIKQNTLVSPRIAKQIAVKYKEILVRSPLTCQTEKSVCQLCYGMDLAQGKLVSIGEAVGIIAAQSIGEPGTQLTMRTFHTGGVGVFSEQSMKSFTAPFPGKIQFLDSLSGRFVRTPHGKIVYLVKNRKKKTGDFETSRQKPILRLISFKDPRSSFEIEYQEIPAGSLLWVKNGEIVKSGQLLIQASRLETAKKEMPESSHPVRTPISGQVFFESMRIREIQDDSKKQKVIEPVIPTLARLGNFWILSCFIQKESRDIAPFFLKKVNSSLRPFFVKGDLISRETPISEYNLYLPERGQLKKGPCGLLFGTNVSELRFSQIRYSNGFYFFLNPQSENHFTKRLFSYTRTSKFTQLIWYPDFKNSSSQSPFGVKLGYFTPIEFELVNKNLGISELTDNSALTIQNLKSAIRQSVWSPHQLFQLKVSSTPRLVNKALSPFCFLFSQEKFTLSQTGVFQIANQSRLAWAIQKKQQPIFFKNPQQIKNTNVIGLAGLLAENPSAFSMQAQYSIEKLLQVKKHVKLIQKQKGWFYFSETFVSDSVPSNLGAVLLEPGKNFENVCFENSYVSVNLVHRQNLRILNSTNKQKENLDLEETTRNWLETDRKTLGNFQSEQKSFSRHDLSNFCFYKKSTANPQLKQKLTLNFFQLSNLNRIFVQIPKINLEFQIKYKKQVSHLVLFQKNTDQFLLDQQFFKQTWLLQNRQENMQFCLNSPLFTKQYRTSFNSRQSIQPTCHISTPTNSTWGSSNCFVKVKIEFSTPKSFQKIEQFLTTQQNSKDKSVAPGFRLQISREVKLDNLQQFKFQTFSSGWVLPNFPITQAYLKSQKLGEYRRIQSKHKQISLCFLRNQDLITLKLPVEYLEKKNFENGILWNQEIGDRVRWGYDLGSGLSTQLTGQILKKTANTLTLRKGIPLLASRHGLVHIEHNDLIEKNDLLITLRSRRLQTEDIVQGIPKIEQLFEARETQGGEILKGNMHMRLSFFFKRARRGRPLADAVEASILYIQKFLVDEILQAYSNQGVHIAEKHVEVVVRQMTARVRITSGGATGLLPGEFIQHRLIQKINARLEQAGRVQATYEPLILGITKSVLQSESFLLAASFQQVSKVLVQSALANKTDFLRGLHENLLVGQPIPAGTGIVLNSTITTPKLEFFGESEFDQSQSIGVSKQQIVIDGNYEFKPGNSFH